MADSANDNGYHLGDPERHGHRHAALVRANSPRQRDCRMMRAIVIGGSLGGLTAALVLRDQGWDIDILERSANPLEGRGTGIVVHPNTVRYLVERVGKPVGDIGLSPPKILFLG